MSKAPRDSRIPVGGQIAVAKAAKGAVHRTFATKIKLPMLKPINRLVDNKKHEEKNDERGNKINVTYDKIPNLNTTGNVVKDSTFIMSDEKNDTILPELNNKTFDLGENILDRVLEAKEKDVRHDMLLKDYEVLKLTENIGNKVSALTSNNPLSVNTVNGTLKFVGRVQNCDEIWCGIETERPSYDYHDGTFNGVKYFSCKKGHGFMVPASYVILQFHNQSIPDPKILELRKRLHSIKTKANKPTDENRRPNVIDITQQLIDDSECDSGPYSLLIGCNNVKTECKMRNKSDIDEKSKESKQKRCSTEDIDDFTIAKKSNLDLPDQDATLIEDESMPEFTSVDSEFLSVKVNRSKLTEDEEINEKTLCAPPIDGSLTMIDDVSMPSYLSFNSTTDLNKSLPKSKPTENIWSNSAHGTNHRIEDESAPDFLSYDDLSIQSRKDSIVCSHTHKSDRVSLSTPPNNLQFECVNSTPQSLESSAKIVINSVERTEVKNPPKKRDSELKLPNLLSPTASDNSVQELSKQNSFDESLGILTPEQMNSLSFLENAFSPSADDVGLNSDKITEKTGSSSPQTPTEIMKSLTPDAIQGLLQPDQFQTMIIESEAVEETIVSEMFNKTDDHETYEDFIQRPFRQSTAENLQSCNELFPTVASQIDDELLPSVHSSILDAFSSMVDTRFDNIQHVRVDQTPSPEELPLDPIDIKSDLCPLSTDPKTDPSKSVTYSITSIISLDGYQGDGEMSRPVSRGADQSPTIGHRVNNNQNWQNIPISRRPDPMTDSDFFTESDADGLDEHHVHRGDRRAQVIDGALYGGSKGSNPPVLVSRNGNSNDDSCMESSGVFTDMETHRCSPLLLNVIDDISPEGSSPSIRSDLSQNKNGDMYHGVFANSLDDTVIVNDSDNKDHESKSPVDLNKSSFSGSKAESRMSSSNNTSSDKMNKEDKNMALKKYKMPRRDVASKVKTLFNSNKSLDNQDKPAAPKKEGRWDAVMNKISVNKNEPKSYLKDIKSKINSSQSFEKSSLCEDSLGKSKAKASPSKLKTRRVKSSRMPKINMLGNSNRSTPHSSQSDLSVSCSAPPKITSAKHTTTRAAKKREVAGGPGRPLSPPTNVPANTPAHVPNPPLGAVPANGTAVQCRNRTPPVGRPGTLVKKPTGVALPGGPPVASVNKGPAASRKPIARRGQLSPKVQPLKEQNRASSPANVLKVPPRALPQAPALPQSPPVRDVEALAVLVQYLVFQLDAFNCNRWKNQATQSKSQLAEANARLQRAISSQRADEKKLTQYSNKVAQLEDELRSKDAEYTNRFMNVNIDAENRYKDALQCSKSLSNEIADLKVTLEKLKQDVKKSKEKIIQAETSSHYFKTESQNIKNELNKANDEIISLKNQNNTLKNALIAKEKESEMYRIAQQQEAKEISVVRQASEDVCGVASKIKLNEVKMAAEIESLKSVLDMKLGEVGDLRKKCEELQTCSDQLSLSMQRVATLTAQIEDIRLQLNHKIQEEQNLTQQLKLLQENYSNVTNIKNKLAMQNEELTYKLQKKSIVTNYLAAMKQNSEFPDPNNTLLNQTYPNEKFIRGQPQRASTGISDKLLNIRDRRQKEWMNNHKQLSNGANNGSMDSFTDDLSPPNSPKIKGVVEKNASVSYVLEIEDTPEEIANRLVRCGSSARMSTSLPNREAVKRQRSKQKSISQLNATIPLAQSASASCIDPIALRSGSTQRKLFRSNSVENQKFSKPMHKRTSTPLKNSSDSSHHFSATDSSNENETKDINQPSNVEHSDISNSDLVLLNKCELVPKESGGEALVSGTNSEDDSSLDEHLHSSSDCDSGSECDKYVRRNGAGERMADPVLEKIAETLNNSLLTTPMDVSWSEDCVVGVSDTDI